MTLNVHPFWGAVGGKLTWIVSLAYAATLAASQSRVYKLVFKGFILPELFAANISKTFDTDINLFLKIIFQTHIIQ
jgi:hypothetical protein